MANFRASNRLSPLFIEKRMHDFARKHGFTLHPLDETGIPEIQFLRDRWRAQIAGCIEAFWLDKSETIELGLAETYTFNALALRWCGRDAIIVHMGMIFALRNLFALLVSGSRAFPERMDADWEPVDWGPHFDSLEALKKVVCQPTFGSPPMGERRDRLLIDLTLTAIDFMFFHELAHIRNGHTRWAAQQTGLEAIVEALPAQEGMSTFDRMVLETDADAFAFVQLFRQSATAEMTPDQVRHNLRILCFSAYAFFRLSDDRAVERLDDLEGMTHPPAILRQFAFMGIGFQLTDQVPAAKGIYEAISVPTLLEAEEAFTTLGLPNKNPYRGNAHDVSGQFIRVRQRRWAELRPSLDQLRRGGNLAPPETDD